MLENAFHQFFHCSRVELAALEPFCHLFCRFCRCRGLSGDCCLLGVIQVPWIDREETETGPILMSRSYLKSTRTDHLLALSFSSTEFRRNTSTQSWVTLHYTAPVQSYVLIRVRLIRTPFLVIIGLFCILRVRQCGTDSLHQIRTCRSASRSLIMNLLPSPRLFYAVGPSRIADIAFELS